MRVTPGNNRKKAHTLILLFVTLLVLMASCSYTPAPVQEVSFQEEPVSEEPPETLYASLTDVRTLGRAFQNEQTSVVWFGFTCSGFEFVFSGKGKVEATFLTDNFADETYSAYIGVFIGNNEKPSQYILMDALIKTVTLYECDWYEQITIRVEKLSELKFSDIALMSLRTTGNECKIAPTEPREMLIEFIGDSITSGYGVLTNDIHEPFSTATEDGSQTYSAFTAKRFKADLRVVSYSGCGVYRSNIDPATNDEIPLLGEIYRKSDIRRSDLLWDFAKQQPADYIILNIGTNDGGKIQEDPAVYGPEFGSVYLAFLEKLRFLNPDSYIICTLGPMYYTSEEFVLSAWQKFALTDKKTGFMFIEPIDREEEGIGAAGHPTLATHMRMAEKLIHRIELIEKKRLYEN